jgi:hypothetical protein
LHLIGKRFFTSLERPVTSNILIYCGQQSTFSVHVVSLGKVRTVAHLIPFVISLFYFLLGAEFLFFLCLESLHFFLLKV